MMRMLVTGTSGQVARSLVERGALRHDVEIVTLGRPLLDLERPETIAGALERSAPDILISVAAFTAVDQAERECDRAMAANALAPGVIASAAAKLDIPIVHLSTDYVFDGTNTAAYREGDEPRPLNIYGRSKLAGEAAVAAATHDHVILRTSWVYSPFGTNFVKTMMKLGRDRAEVAVVADQRGLPTSALDIADCILDVAVQLLVDRRDRGKRGVFHFGGLEATDWASLAEHVFAASAALGGPSARVRRIASADFPVLAARPASSILDTAKIHAVFGVRSGDWRASVSDVVARLLQSTV